MQQNFRPFGSPSFRLSGSQFCGTFMTVAFLTEHIELCRLLTVSDTEDIFLNRDAIHLGRTLGMQTQDQEEFPDDRAYDHGALDDLIQISTETRTARRVALMPLLPVYDNVAFAEPPPIQYLERRKDVTDEMRGEFQHDMLQAEGRTQPQWERLLEEATTEEAGQSTHPQPDFIPLHQSNHTTSDHVQYDRAVGLGIGIPRRHLGTRTCF